MINLYKNPVVDTTQYGYVYRITNLLNGKTYIGKLKITNVKNSPLYKNNSRLMHNLLLSQGINNFKYEILKYASSILELNNLLVKYIKYETNLGKAEYNRHSLELLSDEDLRQIGIYTITTPSGKVYVGMTANSFSSRWYGHLKNLCSNSHRCIGLQRAYNKYGLDNLDFKIIYAIENSNDEININDLLLKEQETWDDINKTAIIIYNARPTATGSVYHTDSTKKQISDTLNLRRDDIYSDLNIHKNNIIKLLKDPTVSLNDIAKIYNIGINRMRKYRKYLGVEYNYITDAVQLYCYQNDFTVDEFNNKVYNMVKSNMNKESVAEYFGITPSRVGNICKIYDKYSPALLSSHTKFHVNYNKVYDDCQYCLDSGQPITIITPTFDELYDLFVIQNMNQNAIANKYNISKAKVQQLLYISGISR